MDKNETNNEILTALSQVPELVKNTNQVLEDNDSLRKLAAEAMKQRVQAVVTEDELQKIASAAAESVAKTPCKLPDPTLLSHDVAKLTTSLLRDTIRNEAVNAVKEAIKETPVRVEHHHTHASLYEISKLAGDRLRRGLIALSVTTTVLGFILTTAGIAYFRSDIHFGKKYVELYRSPFVTDAEREMMAKDLYYPIAVPKEFRKTPTSVKARLKQNREIIRQREMEAKSNKGKYSTKIPLER